MCIKVVCYLTLYYWPRTDVLLRDNITRGCIDVQLLRTTDHQPAITSRAYYLTLVADTIWFSPFNVILWPTNVSHFKGYLVPIEAVILIVVNHNTYVDFEIFYRVFTTYIICQSVHHIYIRYTYSHAKLTYREFDGILILMAILAKKIEKHQGQ